MGKYLLVVVLLTLISFPAKAQASITYYVDCTDGNDGNNGVSTSSAWRSIAKANEAPLIAGDKLLFKRGCTWVVKASEAPGKLALSWSGTATSPITIGTYGTGNKPVIRSDAGRTDDPTTPEDDRSTYETNVFITGNYLIIEDLKTDTINYHHDSTCLYIDNSPARLGWYAGFTVQGDNNILRHIEASEMAVGVFFQDSSNNNKLLNSYFHDLNTFTRIYHSGGAFGSLGLNLHGSDHEVGYNVYEASKSITECIENSTGPNPGTSHNYSAPFEIYNSTRVNVHHTKAFGHRKHSELGKDATATSSGNILAYNLFISDQPNARGPNIHGSDIFGPVTDTKLYNNTIVFTGAGSEAIIAGSSGISKNNIYIAEAKAAFYSIQMVESNNLYWDYQKTSDSLADPCVQFSGSGCSNLTALTSDLNPAFVNAIVPSGNFHLLSTSPAIDRGVAISGLTSDMDGAAVPQLNGVDAGAYEYFSGADFDQDGRVDIDDYQSLLGTINTLNCLLNLTNNCQIDIFDLNYLINRFGL